MKFIKSIGLFKFLFAIAVVSIHTRPFIAYPLLDNAWGVVTRMAVPFFFVCTGYFAFRRFEPGNIKLNRTIAGKTIFRIFALYIIANLCYLPFYDFSKQFSLPDFCYTILFRGIAGHLWFLPAAILGVAACTFSLSFLSFRKTFAVAAVIFAVSTLLSTYTDLFNTLPGLRSELAYWNSENLFQNGLSFGMIYLLLGYAATQHNTTQHNILPFKNNSFISVLCRRRMFQ